MSNDLSNLYQFFKYSRNHAADEVSKNPWRLAYGSVDPASTWVWNKITGKDDKPLINSLGSPMGGGGAGLSKNGGVYADAKTDGQSKGSIRMGKTFFTIGDTIAAYEGGGALMGAMGGGSGAAAGGDAAAGGEDAGLALGNTGTGGLFGSTGGSTASTGGGAMSTYGGGAAKAAGGLLAQGQTQPQSAPQQQMAMQQPDVQAQQASQIRLQQEMELQALRQKPNKTMDEWMQLQKATHNQGLLG